MNNKYDDKGNASHYSDQRINMIRVLEAIWGTHALMTFCEMNAFKYRMRMGKKDGTDQELTKANWYEKMATFLNHKEEQIKGLGPGKVLMFPGFEKTLEDE